MKKEYKVLIWDLEISIKNTGGPGGYLYNLKYFLKQHSHRYNNIFFLKDLLDISIKDKSLRTKYSKWVSFIEKYDYLKIHQYWKVIKCCSKWGNICKKEFLGEVNLNDFDFIHFHSSIDLYNSRKVIRDFKGKTILTSHSPQPLSNELAEYITWKNSFVRQLAKNYMLPKELTAWKVADYLMFPVVEAVEPYCTNVKMKNYIAAFPQKLLYCATSILENENIKRNRNIFKEKCGIEPSNFIVTYIGRHNEVKGYDQLKLLAERIFDKHKDIYFVIGGNESPIQGIKHEQWIELGWIDYGQDLIASSDLFILPNKETYFDLVTLEVLRAGTPLMMSSTGGNKHFRTYPKDISKGLFFFEYGDINYQQTLLEDIYELKRREVLKEYATSNKILFASCFTMESYFDRYTTLLGDIFNKSRENEF